jgi:hypothetical protein
MKRDAFDWWTLRCIFREQGNDMPEDELCDHAKHVSCEMNKYDARRAYREKVYCGMEQPADVQLLLDNVKQHVRKQQQLTEI